jgi:Pyruvate/2-oxoacid:ferredoxin oxidoreductase delta subunit
MEGDGPAGGTPRQVGAVLASADCLALDVVASSMAGLDPLEVYSTKSGHTRGMCPATADELDIVGADWRDLSPEAFELPAGDPTAKMPVWLGKRLRNWVTAKPLLARKAECTRCKSCEKNCPVGAIVVGAEGPVFDYGTCIRCYCCQELCPPQVIGLKTPPLAKFITRGRGY